MTPTFTIDEQATAQPASGVAQDFTDPVPYTVTSGAGESNVYTVTVSVAPATPDPDDQAAADAVMEQINALPAYDDIYLNDRETIAAARAAYEALEPLQKIIIVNDLDKLTEAEQAIANLEANPLRVAMVGDSITEGAGASNSYRNYVSQAAAILGDEFDVLNVGRGGMTLMSTPEAYTNTEQYQQGLDFNPDIVTIMLGTNDGKDRYWGMYSETQYNAAQFEEEMTELINSYRELPSRPIVFVATSPTVYGKQVDTIDNKYVPEIVEVQKKVAADMGCPVIDINTFTQNHSEWFGDGVHPNDAGYAEIAKEFAAAVAEVNKAELDTIQVGEMTIEVESGLTEYTGFIPEGTEIPEIIVEGAYGATYEIGEVSDQLPSSVEITVYSKNGNYRNTYTLNLEQGEIPVTIVPGDLDNDEEVTIADVMEACKVMARESAGTDPSDDEIKRGDLDGDEEITIADVMEICKILARQ